MPNGIIVLDPVAAHAFNMNGNAQLWVNAPIQVDSKDETAVFITGNAKLVSPALSMTGNYALHGNPIIQVDEVLVHQPPVSDPLRFLPAPDAASLIVRSTQSLHLSQGTTALQPGVYIGGINIDGVARVTMAPGIYYMQGGGFSVTGQSSLLANEVMIYNDPKLPSDFLKIAGLGGVIISPPSQGVYQGIAFFQRRDADVKAFVVGNANLRMSGAFYAASAEVKIAGRGASYIGSQYISRLLEVRGNGELHIDWEPQLVPTGCVK